MGKTVLQKSKPERNRIHRKIKSNGENHSHSYRELGRKHSMIGKHGYDNKQSKEVICVTTGVKYGSVTDAANKLGLSFQNVSKVCKGKRHHTGGYVFKFTQV